MKQPTNEPQNAFETWLSIKEVTNLLNVSERAIQKGIKSGKSEYKWRLIDGPGRGGKQYEVALSSLPPTMQLFYYKDHYDIKEDNSRRDAFTRIMGDKKLRGIIIHRSKIIERAAFIRRTGPKNVKQALEKYCKEENISLATLYRWEEAHKRDGVWGLHTIQRKDIGISRSYSREAIIYMKAEYIRTMSKIKAYRNTLAMAGEKGWSMGSQRSAYNELDVIPKWQLVLSKEGRKGLEDKILPPIRRDHSHLRPLEVVFGDHHQFDVMCYDQYGFFRPWITAWMDAHSRAIVGFCLSKQPDSFTIGLALRHACLPKSNPDYVPYGIPEMVYIDNGKDYRGHYLSGNTWKERHYGKIDLNQETKIILDGFETKIGLFNELNIKTKFAKPYNAKAKLIERWFKTLEEQFCQFQPGWTGRNPQHRPEKLKAEMENGDCLTLEEFYPHLENYIVNEYHRNPHRGLKDISPNTAWKKHLKRGWQPRTYNNERIFDFLLLEEEKRYVSNSGIQLKNKFYVNDELILRAYHEWVEVRYHPYDHSMIHVFKEGQYLCSVEAYKYATLRDSHEEISERIAEKRHLSKIIMNQHRGMLKHQEKIAGENNPFKANGKIVPFHPKQSIADNHAKGKQKIKDKRAARKQAEDGWQILERQYREQQ